jgi:dihydroflavonol-4-reductase
MRAFVTGATGFIGSRTVRRLRERGDEVVALVRDAARARWLQELGCELVPGDLGDAAAILRGTTGADAVLHIGAIYQVGIAASARDGLIDANVRGTERVLDAAEQAGVSRIVHVSTGNVYGNTHGRTVDETYTRPQPPDFLSVYDESKYAAHQIALQRIARGAPIVIVAPGGVYGPGDHSELGNIIDQTRSGKMKLRMFPETGFNFVYVDDVADGILLALDRGRIGESYNLAGEKATIGDLIDATARLAGRRAPRLTMPPALIRLSAPAGPLVGPLLGFPPNLRELIRTSDGVTFWMTDEKARRELGFAPRDLSSGLRLTLAGSSPGVNPT